MGNVTKRFLNVLYCFVQAIYLFEEKKQPFYISILDPLPKASGSGNLARWICGLVL